ncbi:MAG: (deoxy)nucleoside triphosphate pyrophosphohydrolase [Muribaculaceae bacterium]|nr:(deoxy)nucleoside triphosphate pyrophosphohydrolase [Muribaculaceae bacterium]
MKMIRVVGAVIRDKFDRILVAQRPYSEISYKSYKWEFPGGKVEENEAPEAALKREILEELDCEIIVEDKIVDVEYDYPDFKLKMDLYRCRLKEGAHPKALEHNQIKWITPDEIHTFDWIEADYKILPVIQKQFR